MPQQFKASKIKTGGSSRGSQAGVSQLMAYMLAQKQNEETTQGIGSTLEQVNRQFPGGPPVGSTLNVGKNVSANIPLNRNLTSEEMSAITADKVFGPIGEEIKGKTREGVFDSPLGNIGRTYRQYAAGQPNALLTSYDPLLQSVQGKINSIRRYVFGEGGKQLTPYEANIVNALIEPLGKSNEQYESDLDEALKLIETKASLASGGMNAITSPVPGMPNQNNTNIEQMRMDARKKIESGKYDSKKVADIFRSITGQEL